MKNIIIWLKPMRLKFYILAMLPILGGSLIAFNETRNFNLSNFIFALLIALFAHIATAFFNDYADVETDNLNNNFNMFSGGSRIIVNGLVSTRQILSGAWIAAFASISLSITFLFFLKGHPIILILNLIGLLIGIEYSLGPLKINYRGFGEVFVILMYSIFALSFGYVTQGAAGFDRNILYLSIPIAIAIFLMILITEIPDYESDKSSGKKTIPTIFGKEVSLGIFFLSVVILYLSILILYLSGIINKSIFLGLFYSLPLGIFLSMLSVSKEKLSPKNIAALCTATILLNLWVNLALCLNLLFGFR